MPRPPEDALREIANLPEATCPMPKHRTGVGWVVNRLLELEELPEEDDEMPSVQQAEEPVVDAEVHLIRDNRYAYAGALGIELIKRQLIFDPEEPSEELSVRLSRIRQSTHPNPYIRFAQDLVEGFRASYAAFEQEPSNKASRLASHHDALLAQDNSTKLTRIPVSSESIRNGNEGPFEMAGLSAVVQLLTQDGPHKTAEERQMIAHSIVDTNIRERAAWGILTFVCNPSLYAPPSFNRPDLPAFDLAKASLVLRSGRTKAPYRIDFGDQQVAQQVSPLVDLACPLKYAKPPGHQLNYLELWLHAAINTAYDEGLFSPDLVPEH